MTDTTVTIPTHYQQAVSFEETWSTLTKKRQMPLSHIFQWLPVKDLVNYQFCSKQFRDTMIVCQLSTSTEHVLMITDALISKGQIFDAERFLRPHVCRSDVSVKIINRYILILHGDIFDNEKNYLCDDQRIEIIKHFVKTANSSIHPIDSHLCDKILNHITEKTNSLPLYLTDTANKQHKCKFERQYHTVNKTYTSINSTVHTDFDTNHTAHCFVAYICFKYAIQNNILEAIELYCHDSTLYNWVNGAVCHYVNNDYSKSYFHYTKAITLSPDFAYAYYSLSALTLDIAGAFSEPMKQKIYDEAHRLLTITLELDDLHYFAMMNEATLFDEEIDLEIIGENYDHVLRIHPSSTMVNRCIADLIVHYNVYDTEYAIELMEKAIEIAPHYPDNMLNIANVYIHANRHSDANTYLKKYLETPSIIFYKNNKPVPPNDSTREYVRSLIIELENEVE